MDLFTEGYKVRKEEEERADEDKVTFPHCNVLPDVTSVTLSDYLLYWLREWSCYDSDKT